MPFGGLFERGKKSGASTASKDLNAIIRKGLEEVDQSFGAVLTTNFVNSKTGTFQPAPEAGLAFLSSLAKKMEGMADDQLQDKQQTPSEPLIKIKESADFKMLADDKRFKVQLL
jgi:hypothetical protein